MEADTRKHKARFFRLRVILSPVLVIVGVVPVYCGYKGLLHLPFSVIITGVVMMLAGLCLQLTLAHCPFCGARVNLRSGLLLWNIPAPTAIPPWPTAAENCGPAPGKLPLPPLSGGRCV